jgi:hypothetical protein
MSVSARKTGKKGSWRYGESPTKVSGLVDWSLDGQAAEVDATAMEDDDEITLDGIPKYTGSATLRYESDSEAQKVVIIGALLPVKLYSDETHYIGGTMKITGRGDAVQHNETINISVKFSLRNVDYSNYYDVAGGSS